MEGLSWDFSLVWLSSCEKFADLTNRPQSHNKIYHETVSRRQGVTNGCPAYTVMAILGFFRRRSVPVARIGRRRGPQRHYRHADPPASFRVTRLRERKAPGLNHLPAGHGRQELPGSIWHGKFSALRLLFRLGSPSPFTLLGSPLQEASSLPVPAAEAWLLRCGGAARTVGPNSREELQGSRAILPAKLSQGFRQCLLYRCAKRAAFPRIFPL